MNERFFPRCRVYAAVTWAAVAVFILSAWGVMFANWRLAFLLGGTGCALASVAGALTVRSFTVRLAAMVRSMHGVEAPVVKDGLHTIR